VLVQTPITVIYNSICKGHRVVGTLTVIFIFYLFIYLIYQFIYFYIIFFGVGLECLLGPLVNIFLRGSFIYLFS
jgi:hypothetical protein